jgi:hypothetical protein
MSGRNTAECFCGKMEQRRLFSHLMESSLAKITG